MSHCEKEKSEKEGQRRGSTERNAARTTKSTKRPDAMQRSVRNRNQRKKVDEEAQRNATQRGSARKRNHRNKVNQEA